MWKKEYEQYESRRLRYNMCCDTTRLYTSLSLSKALQWASI